MAKIFIGADHAGFSLKQNITKEFPKVTDLTPTLDPKDDYPAVAKLVAEKVAKSKSKGILVCGSGIGIAIAANKVKGIRAATCHDVGDAIMARKDNDANIVCMGGRVTSSTVANKIIEAFLATPFAGNAPSGKRHKKRVNMIKKMEQ